MFKIIIIIGIITLFGMTIYAIGGFIYHKFKK